MGLFDDQTKFVQDGAEYEHADPRPELAPGSVRRFVYGGEPKIIAQVPLAGGGTVEVHGYAEHWTKDEVVVVWRDDKFQHCSAWTPVEKVRRPDEGEWHGNYVSR